MNKQLKLRKTSTASVALRGGIDSVTSAYLLNKINL